MAMMIRERMDGGLFYKNIEDYKEEPLDLTEADHSFESVDPDSIMVDIEAIHAAPFATRNFTRYMSKCLKNSVPSWTQPYRRPLIKHHNEENGEIIGRVQEAKYKTNDTLSGTPAILLTVNVPGQAKADVKNGLLETTSIGAIAHDVRCSICGQHLENGDMCEHERGVTYKTDSGPQVCTWDIYDMEAKEISFVVVPSDIYSKKIAVYPAVESNQKTTLTESLDESIERKGEPDMAETKQNATELQGAKAQISELEKKLTDSEEAKKASDAKVTESLEAIKASEAKVAEVTESNKALEAKVAELTDSNKTLEAKVTELTDSVTKMTEQMANEAKMKEGLENALAESKAQLKESMIETVQIMRKMLGRKELNADAVKERAEDSLRDSINDMKEELSDMKTTGISVAESAKTEPPTAGSVANPTLSDQKDAIDAKESATNEKIDLKSGLANLFGKVLSAR